MLHTLYNSISYADSSGKIEPELEHHMAFHYPAR